MKNRADVYSAGLFKGIFCSTLAIPQKPLTPEKTNILHLLIITGTESD